MFCYQRVVKNIFSKSDRLLALASVDRVGYRGLRPSPLHTTVRAVFRIRRLNAAVILQPQGLMAELVPSVARTLLSFTVFATRWICAAPNVPAAAPLLRSFAGSGW